MKLHPDKGGDPEKFKELNNAYETLKDPQKREIYDNPTTSQFNPFNFFNNFMNNNNNNHRQLTEIKIMIPINALLVPTKYNLQYERSIKCSACDATGSSTKSVQVCSNCNGRKIEVKTINVANGFQMSLNQPCSLCSGKGTTIANKCMLCSGNGTIKYNENLLFNITFGVPDGFPNVQKTIIKHEMGHYSSELNKYTDLKIICDIDTSNLPKEFNIEVPQLNIVIKLPIDLVDCLCGFKTYNVTLPSGEAVTLTSESVISPDTKTIIPNEGLCYENNVTKRGNLIIKWDIKFPKNLSSNTKRDIISSLGQSSITNAVVNSTNRQIRI
jgi:DnaJ-class molecular chaperone